MRLLSYALGAMLIACAAAGCRDSKTKSSVKQITFYQHVAPIVWKNCTSCHRKGEIAPFELITLDQVKKHASQIAKVTASRFMPPWLPEKDHGEFADERRLSDEQIATIAQWVKEGCADGQPTQPPPNQWVEGWQLGPPDLVVQMPGAYVLPPDGKDIYRNFVMPLPIAEPKWVRAVEFRMGTTVVHHAFMLIDRSGTARRRDAQDAEPGYGGMDAGDDVGMPEGHMLSWQPGRIASAGSSERAWRLNKGTDLVLQMHMRPNGRPESVRSSVGFYFSDKPPTQLSYLLVIRPPVIDIPATDANHVVESSYTLPIAVQVIGVLPHAHYLGKELAGSATLPDGTTKPLVLIKNWDFNWQSDYRYKQPLTLPRGTKVSMRFVFDNSDQNVHNPNHPPKPVRYGPNSTDEMAELWLEVVPHNYDDLRKLLEDYVVKFALPDAVERSRGVLKYEPQNAEWRGKLGVALAKSGKLDEGLAELRKAVAQEPQNAKTHYMLAATLVEMGNVSEGIDEYEQVLKLDPESYASHNNLGLIYLRQAKFDRAAHHLYNAVRISPNDVLANVNLAKLFLLQQNLGQARLQLKTILDIDPENRFAGETLPRVEAALEKNQ